MAEGEVRIKELEEITTLTQNHYFVVDDSSSGGKSKKYQADKVTAPLDNALLNEASSYDTTHTYNEGDYCLKDNVLYRCLYDNVTGTWTASKWVQTSLGADLTENTNDTQQAFVEGTASGAIASFADGSNLPLKSLTAYITAIQDLHGYDYPWVGGSGRNLFNMGSKWSGSASGLSFTTDDDYVTMNGTKSGANYVTPSQLYFDLPAGTYYAKAFVISGTTSNAPSIYVYSNQELTSNMLNTERSFTIESQTSVGIRFAFWNDGATYSNYKIGIVISKTYDIDKFYPYSNECPILGWSAVNVTRCGKNLWGGEKLADDIVAKVPNATKDTTNKTVSFSAGFVFDKVLFDNFKPNTVYTIFMMTSSSANNVMVRYTDGTTDYINKYSFTVTQANKSIECIVGIWSTGTTVLKYEECGIFEGALTAEDFEPYNGQTYKVEFKDGDNPLTVYGGTLDVVSGVLTVTHLVADMGDLDWAYDTSRNGYFWVRLPLKKNNTTIISSIYPYKGTRPTSYSGADKGIYQEGTTNDYLDINDSSYGSDVNALITAVTGQKIVYELATPLTYQLSKQQIRSLVGENNIFASTGSIKNVTYRRDNNTVINGLLNNIQFVTQAQYDALPSSKTSNGVLYFITG